mgnify:CR=1 FL=1|jgi:hypothetical protein
MLYKRLYRKNVNDSINIWMIYYEEDYYYTKYGKLGGKLIETKPTKVTIKNVGKNNETSIDEQVLNEISSIVRNKIDEGYVDDISHIKPVEFDKPMLANNYSSYDESMKFIQPKLDGIRCLANKLDCKSRQGKTFISFPHIEKELDILRHQYPSIVFDGELYNHKLNDNFNKIVSLVKKVKLTKEELIESESLIEYHVYDMWDINNPNMTFSERFYFLTNKIRNFNYIKLVQTEPISCENDINMWFNTFTSNGYEGAIIRKDMPYEHKRSNNLLKKKEFIDNEFKIIDILQGIGNKSDVAGSVLLKDEKSNLIFKSNIKGNWEFCKDLLENKEKYIGLLGTVKFTNLTPKGVPRFGHLISIRNYE